MCITAVQTFVLLLFRHVLLLFSHLPWRIILTLALSDVFGNNGAIFQRKCLMLSLVPQRAGLIGAA